MKTTRMGLGRRGIALPVALVGLVAVSLLATTALLTSSAEFAISSAHTQGSRTLYTAENGLQQFVAQLAAAPQLLAAGSTRDVTVQVGYSAAQTQQVRITTDQLSSITAGPTAPTDYVFAITAQPLDPRTGQPRGRAVVGFVQQQRRPMQPLSTNITSAITLGGNLDVNGNAFTVNGRFNGCGVSGGVDAVQAASGSVITANNSNHWKNFLGSEGGVNTTGQAAIDRTSMTKEELASQVLGGTTLDDLIAIIPNYRKWGPKFDRPTWNGYVPDTAAVAVVDANGGTVSVLGGTGVLIVVNGNIQMRGNATFEGIIIVEGNFDLAGTPTVQGALISLATAAENNVINLDESAIGSGHITVQFDKCAIIEAEQAFANQAVAALPDLSSGLYAWFEVVR